MKYKIMKIFFHENTVKYVVNIIISCLKPFSTTCLTFLPTIFLVNKHLFGNHTSSV